MKEMIVVGGANGTGKTTFSLAYARQRSIPYLGADAIALEISPDAPAGVAVAAGSELLRRLQQRLNGHESFVLETTLAGRTLKHSIESARSLGFRVTVLYLYVDSEELCVARVRERVAKGGHDVPEPDIRRRYTRSLRNFWGSYRLLADSWVLVYNGGDSAIDVAVGTGQSIFVRDEQQFAMFQALTGVERNG